MNATNLTTEERRDLISLLRCLSAFAEINSNMPVGEALTFVQVALEPGQGPDEYFRLVGVPDSTMSRWLLDLGNEGRGATEVKLLQWRANPQNLRRKQYFLSGKGIALINKFLSHHGRKRDEH